MTKKPYRGSWSPGKAAGTWSFWNTPIGSEAVLRDSGLQNHTNILGKNISQTIRTDPIHLGFVGQPVKLLSASKRSDGTYYEGREPWKSGHSVRVHVDPTDTGPGDYSRGNSIGAWAVENDSTRVWQGHPLKLVAGDDPSVRYVDPHNAPHDLYGDGHGTGAHGGSHLTALSCIRQDEWDSPDEDSIRHVIGYNIWAAAYLNGIPQGYTSTNKPRRWPSNDVDSYWNHDGKDGRPFRAQHYGQRAVAPGMVMGSLLALPDSFVTPSNANAKAKKIIRMMRDFGVLVVDDSAYEVHQLSIERTIPWPSSTATDFHGPLFQAFINLKLVDNNASTRPGGGGTPRTSPVQDVTRPTV